VEDPLSKSRFVHEKLAWDGMNGEGEMWFTPPKSLIKDDASLSVVSNSISHLKVNGVVHSYVVKQLTYNLDLYSSFGLPTPKVSTPKPSQ
jgi:hypothetical protein